LYTSTWPATNVFMPAVSTSWRCTKTSGPPSSGRMKPNPRSVLKNFTRPVGIFSCLSSDRRSARPCSRATEQRDELAACHCPMPPVLPTERIAHLGTADSCIHPPGRYETIAVTPPITFSKEVAQKQATPFPRQDLLTARNRRTGSRTFGDTDDGGAGHRACTEDPSAREDDAPYLQITSPVAVGPCVACGPSGRPRCPSRASAGSWAWERAPWRLLVLSSPQSL
jgi:hypothetical protein